MVYKSFPPKTDNDESDDERQENLKAHAANKHRYWKIRSQMVTIIARKDTKCEPYSMQQRKNGWICWRNVRENTIKWNWIQTTYELINATLKRRKVNQDTGKTTDVLIIEPDEVYDKRSYKAPKKRKRKDRKIIVWFLTENL